MGRKTHYGRFSAKRFEMLVRKGWTDQECADFFDISLSTISLWKTRHPEFMEALKKWKEDPNNRVERALFERAIGYTHPAVKMFVIGGKVVTQEYLEHYPPDAASMIFFLKNRKPEEWREKETGDKPVDTRIIIIRDDKPLPLVVQQSQETERGRTISFNT